MAATVRAGLRPVNGLLDLPVRQRDHEDRIACGPRPSGSPAGSRPAPGSLEGGIGLYVCRNLVEAMGRTISARALPTGGAEFGFTLAPYVDADKFGGWPAAADEALEAAGPFGARATAAS